MDPAFLCDPQVMQRGSFAQLVKTRNHSITQVDRGERVEIDARSSFETCWHIDAQFDQDVPRHFRNCINGGVIPFFVVGYLITNRSVTSVDKVAHSANFFIRVIERGSCLRARVDFDRRKAVSDSYECDRLVVFRKHQIAVSSKVGTEVVKYVRIFAQHANLALDR